MLTLQHGGRERTGLLDKGEPTNLKNFEHMLYAMHYVITIIVRTEKRFPNPVSSHWQFIIQFKYEPEYPQ